jgi:hypothetical protein
MHLGVRSVVSLPRRDGGICIANAKHIGPFAQSNQRHVSSIAGSVNGNSFRIRNACANKILHVANLQKNHF